MSQRLLFLSRGRSLAPVDVMRLEKAVPCSPSTCSGVKRFAFSTAFRRRSCSYRPQDLVKSFQRVFDHENRRRYRRERAPESFTVHPNQGNLVPYLDHPSWRGADGRELGLSEDTSLFLLGRSATTHHSFRGSFSAVSTPIFPSK